MKDNTVHLDYETFSELNLKQVGAYVYSEHESTEVICLAFAFNDEDPILWLPGDKPPKQLFKRLLSGKWKFAAHNANFELLIWKNVCEELYGWPALPEDLHVVDTAAVAAMKALPRALDKVCAALKVGQQKDKRGSHLINKLCKPRKPSKNNPATRWTPETAPQDFADFYEYCLQDVRAERDVHHYIGELTPKEYQLWQLDRKINGRGVHVNQKALNGAIHIMDVTNRQLDAEASLIAEGAFERTGQRDKVMEWTAAKGYELDNYTADYLDEIIKDPECPADVRRVIQIRRMTSRTSTKKYLAMARALCADGTIKGTLLYHGAGTGRWSGKILQPQNLPRPLIKEVDISIAIELMEEGDHESLGFLFNDDPSGTMVSCIRGTLVPGPKKEFICGDFSNVEGRGLAWSANDKVCLDMYKKGLDLYIDMATAIYNLSYEVIYDEYKGGDDSKRRMGKLAILGLGYGMGAAKFVATALTKGVTITLEFAKRVVKAYRKKYKAVVAYWKALEKAAIGAVNNPRKSFEVNGVIYKMEGIFLTCKLASGRKLYYPNVEVRSTKTPWGEMKDTVTYMVMEKNHWRRTKTFGGKLAENIVQATSRDLLAESMFRVERAGYPITLTVHDETLVEVLKSLLEKGKRSLKEFSDLMKQLPSWAKGFPMDVDCWQGMRYQK